MFYNRFVREKSTSVLDVHYNLVSNGSVGLMSFEARIINFANRRMFTSERISVFDWLEMNQEVNMCELCMKIWKSLAVREEVENERGVVVEYGNRM